MAFRERRHVRRLLLSDVDGSSVTSHMRDKARGRFDHARCAHSHEDRAFVECTEDAIQLERYLAEPADVRANLAAAFATGNLRWRIVGGRVAERGSGASIAAAFKQFAVHVDDVLRSCLLVQVVHVLRAEEKAVFQPPLKVCEGEVGWIRLRRRSDPPTHGIELPHQPGIATPSIRRGYLFDPVVPPQTIDVTERRYPALGAYACPGEDKEPVGGRKGEHG